jgi:hypothetical protein
MSRDTSEELQTIIDIWQERFGEPPPIITDADLMWQVMRSMPVTAPEDPRPSRQ